MSRRSWMFAFLLVGIGLIAIPSIASPFLVAPTYPVGTWPVAIVAGDFNQDGNIDLITVNTTDENLSVLFGQGQGRFGTTQTMAPPFQYPDGLATTDLNGDGKLDLIVTGRLLNNSGALAVLLGNGDGTFQPAIMLGATANIPQVTITDVNNDHKLDLVVPDGQNVGVYLGNGNGTFRAEILNPTEDYTSVVAVGDFNGDGNPDVAVSDGFDFITVSILLGNGQGSFTQFQDYQLFTYPYVTFMLITDLNGDGKLDLVVPEFSDFSTGQIVAMLGNGDGTFQAPVNIGPGSGTLVLTDINGDGIPDLIALCQYAQVEVYPGRGNGMFGAPLGFFSNYSPTAMVVADFNNDGIPDVATANNFSNSTVAIMLATKQGHLLAPQSYVLPVSEGGPTFVSDLNGDGILDIVTLEGQGTRFYTLLGNGHGGFRPPTLSGTAEFTYFAAMADVNNDGVPDIVTSSQYSSSDIQVLLGRGDGSFRHAISLSVGGSGGPPVLADVNGDGILDLVLPNLQSLSVTIALGNGDGTFRPSEGYLLPDFPLAAAVGDFNNDGKPDVALVSINAVLIMLGNGDGSFGTVRTLQPGSSKPQSVLAADINGDGNVDLLVSFQANTGEPGLTELLGNGNGTFQKAEPVETTFTSIGPLTIADLDGDGVKDLISFYPGVYWLKGTGNGTFSEPVTIDLDNAGGAALGDFNGDGKLDFVIEFGTLNNLGIGVAQNITPAKH